MKKIFFLLVGMILFLAACGDGDAGAENEEPQENQTAPTEEEETEDVSTDDPLAFADKTDENATVLIDGMNEYVIENYYVTDDTDEQGFNTYEDGDFLMRYALVEAENIADVEMQGQRRILILGEIINNADDTYYFNERMLIKTDDKEESEVEFNLNGAGAADQKNKFIDHFNLEYEIPESFTFTVIDPSIQGDPQDKFHEDVDNGKYEPEGNGEEAYKEFLNDNTVIDKEFHKE